MKKFFVFLLPLLVSGMFFFSSCKKKDVAQCWAVSFYVNEELLQTYYVWGTEEEANKTNLFNSFILPGMDYKIEAKKASDKDESSCKGSSLAM